MDQGAAGSAQLQGQTTKEKFRECFPCFGQRCEFLGHKRGRQTRARVSGISGPGHRVMCLSRGAKEGGPRQAGAAGGWAMGAATGLWPQLCPHAPPTYPWVSWHQIPAPMLQLHVTDAGTECALGPSHMHICLGAGVFQDCLLWQVSRCGAEGTNHRKCHLLAI